MSETIDLIALRKAKKELAAYSRDTEQPMYMEKLDLQPIRQVQKIEIGEEFITLTYNEVTKYNYNTKEITHRVWDFKYNNDPEIVSAIAHVIELARKHLRELPENAACPPGCAQCCSGYEPFVSHEDMQRIADHLGMSKSAAIKQYVVERPSADGYIVGYLRKVTDDIASQCVFLKGKESGEHYCGIYEARPHDCDAFTPINCQDVDWTLPRNAPQPTGSPFRPRHPRK
jgi:Fe-S-cluster containining protein